MANYLTTDTELTSIANAIRTKGGTQAQLTYPTGFVSAINDIPTGGGTKPDIVLTGEQQYRFQGSNGLELVNAANYTTSDLSNLTYMFSGYTGTTIPFTLNIGSYFNSIQYMFYNCVNLTTLPTINFNNHGLNANGGLTAMFYNCPNITTIPDGYFSTYNFSVMNSSTGQLGQMMFTGCHNLTHIDNSLLSNLYSSRSNAGAWQQLFYNCYSLPEILNLGIFHPTATVSRNLFSNTFHGCHSLSRLTFAANGAARNYSNQIIGLSVNVGYSGNTANDIANSVYNHISAVETINSLPDCSAVSPPSNPNNYIYFKTGSGANTAGGSVNDLTAEEIAVATNKGWQVAFE